MKLITDSERILSIKNVMLHRNMHPISLILTLVRRHSIEKNVRIVNSCMFNDLFSSIDFYCSAFFSTADRFMMQFEIFFAFDCFTCNLVTCPLSIECTSVVTGFN